jgi:Protein of unknown function (DUF3307)
MIPATVCLTTILTLVWLHFISDFLLQTDWMALGKSSSNKILSIHVAAYSTLFLIVCGPKYALVNFALHWVTDFFSSRATKKLYAAKENHWFFAVIGFDQAVHVTCLLLTIPLIGW